MFVVNQCSFSTGWLSACADSSGPEKLLVLGSLSCLMQRRGFDSPLGRIFPVERIFSLGVNMVSDSILPQTLLDESINRGLVCAYKHRIARAQKIVIFIS